MLAMLRFSLSVILIATLSGCAVSKKQDLQIQQLQSHLNYLESEVVKQREEIVQLKSGSAAPLPIQSNDIEEDFKSFDDITLDTLDFSQPPAKRIQQALKKAGFYKGTVDGKIGPRTSEAIMAFQKKNNLKADGVVGKVTWTELKKHLDN